MPFLLLEIVPDVRLRLDLSPLCSFRRFSVALLVGAGFLYFWQERG